MIVAIKKFPVVILTLVSAFLFCSMLIASSLSPISESGPNANQFGSAGMWSAIGTVLAFYILPLIAYLAGLDAMRSIMAVLCSFGVMINFVIIPVVLGIFANKMNTSLIVVIALCFILLIINTVWFITAFRSSSKSHSVA
ncbi:hypothetical protein AM592_04775 [Bacillus gobiensis]|uniref:DUF5391 family protein n=1 Tax=Bacillus gobiensis TaxID=1441095 RepID=A0A0M4G7H0_9BACI|nr:hypothetical protein AM592_04775 [Bacillus gobiensis]